MTRIHLSPGATVLSSPTHDGLERILAGVAAVARLFGATDAPQARRLGAAPAGPGVAGDSPARTATAQV